LGILQDPAPEVNLVEGGAWLRLADGRECEIRVERVVAGSGVTEFSGAKGILDLHWKPTPEGGPYLTQERDVFLIDEICQGKSPDSRVAGYVSSSPVWSRLQRSTTVTSPGQLADEIAEFLAALLKLANQPVGGFLSTRRLVSTADNKARIAEWS
jgi:hypothetical protein